MKIEDGSVISSFVTPWTVASEALLHGDSPVKMLHWVAISSQDL